MAFTDVHRSARIWSAVGGGAVPKWACSSLPSVFTGPVFRPILPVRKYSVGSDVAQQVGPGAAASDDSDDDNDDNQRLTIHARELVTVRPSDAGRTSQVSPARSPRSPSAASGRSPTADRPPRLRRAAAWTGLGRARQCAKRQDEADGRYAEAVAASEPVHRSRTTAGHICIRDRPAVSPQSLEPNEVRPSCRTTHGLQSIS